jgi:hypothetical protein
MHVPQAEATKEEIFFETNTFPDEKCTCSPCDFGYSEKKEIPWHALKHGAERKVKSRRGNS